MKEKVKVKIQRDAKYFYIQYGSGAEWEKVKITDLPWTVRALLNTFTSGEYEADIEAEEYTGIQIKQIKLLIQSCVIGRTDGKEALWKIKYLELL